MASSITIPNSVTSIDLQAFYGCRKLKSVTILDGVTSIGESAFNDCQSLTSVVIPNSVTSIGEYAFNGCTNIESATISNSVTSISSGVFNGCKNLKSVTIPQSVTTIGGSAFSNCGFGSVVIPSSVTSIGEWAFAHCSFLWKIISLNPVPPHIDSSTFKYTIAGSCVYVPKNYLEDYKNDEEWGKLSFCTDRLLILKDFPSVTYGDGRIYLDDFVVEKPEKMKPFDYESTDWSVATFSSYDNSMSINGAGETTIVAKVTEPLSNRDIGVVGEKRLLVVKKADLTATARNYKIKVGDEMPEFAIDFSGFVYADTEADIDEMPMAVCNISDTSVPGEYEIMVEGGSDRNYNINCISGKLSIVENIGDAVETTTDNADFTCYVIGKHIHIAAPANQTVEVYDIDGIRHYSAQSTGSEITLTPAQGGMYIVRCGRNIAKVVVK